MSLSVSVAGVDHHTPVEIRERFSFTVNEANQTLEDLRLRGVPAVILSTCNRTELWCEGASARTVLGQYRRFDTAQLYEKQGGEAALHLFRVSAGLESRLVGEDQILGQVKEALARAQQNQCSAAQLNQVFRCAISAAKEVKRFVPLHAFAPTAPQRAVDLARDVLARQYDRHTFSDLSVLVIGNGQMGRMAARLLAEERANVTMTRRCKNHPGQWDAFLELPEVGYIDYDLRYQALQNAFLVISATASPHLTMEASAYEMTRSAARVLIDLAVPRDIDPRIGSFAGITLFDVDDIGGGAPENEAQAMAIWKKYEARLDAWLKGHAANEYHKRTTVQSY